MNQVYFDLADRPKGPVAQRLDSPAEMVDLPTLANRWFRQIGTWRIPGLAPLAGDPGLIGRIRGALGARLARGASASALAGRPCTFVPPSAFEVIWRKQGRLSAGYDHASPWVLAVDPADGALDVSITLFGFAAEWMPGVIEQLTQALREDVDWRGRTGLFVPKIDISHRRLRSVVGVATPPPCDGPIELELLSPLAVTGGDPRARPASLILGLLKRVEALARWHDLSVDGTIDRRTTGALARSLRYRWIDCSETGWSRGSERQDRWIGMSGIAGSLMIEADEPLPAALTLLLALGETCHFGADIAFGCGRYRLIGGGGEAT